MSLVSCHLSPEPGLFLHASAVVVEGGAVLFLGHSTAGKSTIARKLGTVLPVLADDSVYAARDAAGIWRVVDGGFRFGQGWGIPEWQTAVREKSQKEGGIPLRACYRIYQGETVRIARLETVELARHLLDAALEIDVQRKPFPAREKAKTKMTPELLLQEREFRRNLLRWTADIARNHAGGALWFARETTGEELRSRL